jgi:HSP20 family protein
MTEPDDLDDNSGDTPAPDSFKVFFEGQKNMERKLREYIKNLIESLKKGELQGRSEIVPIERQGVTGFIFRGVFGTPEALEGEGKVPEIADEKTERSERFSVPETRKEELREPVIEKFENGNEFVLVVELPGVEERDMKVEVADSSITVEALNFKTIIVDLPANSNTSKMTKSYKNGVLELKVPITQELGRDDDVKIGVA